jgi:hypothetical protein
MRNIYIVCMKTKWEINPYVTKNVMLNRSQLNWHKENGTTTGLLYLHIPSFLHTNDTH